jgi:vancomycin aglycone glucosyltransferase
VRVLLSTLDSRGDVEPMVPFGQSVRPLVHWSRFRSAADEPRPAAELAAAQFDTVAAAAQGRHVLVATGVTPAAVWR